MPLLVDIKLLKYMLCYKNERITQLLEKLSIDLNFLVVPWFLLIFSETTNFQLQNVIFSKFLSDGVMIFFKIALFFFKECQEKLQSAKNMMEFSDTIKKHF